MEFIKAIEIKKRMCDKLWCSDCHLGRLKNGTDLICPNFMQKSPAEAEKILIDWDKANPAKTFLTDFLEKYPNAPLNDNGIPYDICPIYLGYTDNDEDCTDIKCSACWNRPLKE